MADFFNIPHIIATYGYLGIFIIVFLESGIFFPLPGDSLLFTAGLFAVAFGLKIYFLIPLIFLATFLGGLAGYEIGWHLVKLRRYTFFNKILKQKHLDKAHEFFERHGKAAITLARFVAVIRTFVPIVAGAARMEYGAFLKYSVIGSLLWSTSVTLLGYFLGGLFPQIKDYIMWVMLIVVTLSFIPVVWEMMQKQKKN